MPDASTTLARCDITPSLPINLDWDSSASLRCEWTSSRSCNVTPCCSLCHLSVRYESDTDRSGARFAPGDFEAIWPENSVFNECGRSGCVDIDTCTVGEQSNGRAQIRLKDPLGLRPHRKVS